MIVYACSSNGAKLEELVIAGQASGIPRLRIEPLPGLQEITAPLENGATFEENASLKAKSYSVLTKELVLADDSGLEVAALDGAPGIYSARYASPNATDAANNELILCRLENQENREARFVCSVALARAGQVLTTVRGSVEGEILKQPRGDRGFGYDPLFFYPPLGRTFAELTRDEKLAVSHRGHALRNLFTYLAQFDRSNSALSGKIG
jgi:XTP/dITP diphosphohydrolase